MYTHLIPMLLLSLLFLIGFFNLMSDASKSKTVKEKTFTPLFTSPIDNHIVVIDQSKTGIIEIKTTPGEKVYSPLNGYACFYGDFIDLIGAGGYSITVSGCVPTNIPRAVECNDIIGYAQDGSIVLQFYRDSIPVNIFELTKIFN